MAIVETSFLLALVTMTLTWRAHGLPKERSYQVERLGSSDLGCAERPAELFQCLFQRTCKIHTKSSKIYSYSCLFVLGVAQICFINRIFSHWQLNMKVYGYKVIKVQKCKFLSYFTFARNLNFWWGHGVKISHLLIRLAVAVLNNKKKHSFKHYRQTPVIWL